MTGEVVIREALEQDGSYILRSNAIQEDASSMWSMYMQLVRIESAFKSLKSDLAIRPIWHQNQSRVEAHIFVAFMGYCLLATLSKYLQSAAPGLSPRAVLEQRRALADHAALHRTGAAARDVAGAVEAVLAGSTAPANPQRQTADARPART